MSTATPPHRPTPPALAAHLAEGSSATCRCWAVIRRDGETFGFTDHDRALAFDGVTFHPESGLSARALEQSTGLSVDNSEAIGALTSDAITDEDIAAGRFDGAEVKAWLVRWDNVADRHLQFRGSLGEMRRVGGAFHAELRGLTEALNLAGGRVFHRLCPAVLGDAACGVDLTAGTFAAEAGLRASEGTRLHLPALSAHAPGWFERGRLMVLDGAAKGLSAVIKTDRSNADGREITLWQSPAVDLAPGDRVRLVTGCDKTPGCCRDKFHNMVNFRGFPQIPGEDWLMSVPRQDGLNDGGSLTQ